ncbi:hypothetical protein HanPSC8_Chr16g0710931 [Helianthus annuus]|nr:hypothetical protein HanPSC8_Chr16g0710931 [Helianthus annuus]
MCALRERGFHSRTNNIKLTNLCSTSYTKNGCNQARQPWYSILSKSHILPRARFQFRIVFLCSSHLFCT